MMSLEEKKTGEIGVIEAGSLTEKVTEGSRDGD